MNYVRLKTNLLDACIHDRLKYNPEMIEFFLNDDDIHNPATLLAKIRELKSLGIQVYLHHPPKYKGKRLDILTRDPELKEFYRHSSEVLADICKQEQIRCVIHAHYVGTESSKHLGREQTLLMKEKIEEVLKFSNGVFLWEDTIEGLFSYANPYLFDELIAPLDLALNVDVSHTFIALRGSNEGLQRVLEMTKNHAQYFHLVDSMGQFHDSLPLGKGLIDWAMVKPYVEHKDFIFEINLSGEHTDCTPMIRSVDYFKQLAQKLYTIKK